MGIQFDDFNQKTDCVLVEMKKIMTDNKLLNEETDILKIKIDGLEQHYLSNSVEIKAITENTNANFSDIVQVIEDKMNSKVIIKSSQKNKSQRHNIQGSWLLR